MGSPDNTRVNRSSVYACTSTRAVFLCFCKKRNRSRTQPNDKNYNTTRHTTRTPPETTTRRTTPLSSQLSTVARRRCVPLPTQNVSLSYCSWRVRVCYTRPPACEWVHPTILALTAVVSARAPVLRLCFFVSGTTQ